MSIRARSVEALGNSFDSRIISFLMSELLSIKKSAT